MKRIFTSLLLLTCVLQISQAQKAQVSTARPAPYDGSFVASTSPSYQSNKKTRKTAAAFISTFGKKELIGTTTYDLQTNGSMQRRVLQNGSNSSYMWTMSQELSSISSSPFSDRGTGYVSYNGGSWSPAPVVRIEGGQRTGFGNLLVDGSGNEFVLNHDGANNSLFMIKKIGGTWGAPQQLTTNTAQKAIWPHAATSGNWLYVVASSSDSLTKSNGIRFGYFFSRSNDNGATWIDDMIELPLVDSSGHYRGGGNSYSISANGSKVVILVGDMGTDLTMLISNDHGATWSKKVIWDWPLENYNFAGTVPTDTNADSITDTLWTNDGSQSVTISNSGNIHAAFPLVRVYKDGSSAGYSFFYSTYMAYYSSVTDSVYLVDNTFASHRNCDNFAGVGIGSNYTGDLASDPDAIYSTIGTLTVPTITTTNTTPEKILITYTGLADNDTTIDDTNNPNWGGTSIFQGQNYRDIYVVANNGTSASNWTYPVNVSRTKHLEDMFPTTAERISGNTLAILAQVDIEPGTVLQNNDVSDDINKNMMIAHLINIDSLFIVGADSTAPCGSEEVNLNPSSVLDVTRSIDYVLYPVPVNNSLFVGLPEAWMHKELNYAISDIAGKILYNEKHILSSSRPLEINVSNLASGVYMLKVGNTIKKFYKE